MKRMIIDNSVNLLGYLLQYRKKDIKYFQDKKIICINLGCGLAIAPGWINVDASLNALFSGMPRWFLNALYRFSGSNRYYSKIEYINILSNNDFIFHDLSRSLPFKNNCIDCFFSSHFVEHLFNRDAKKLLEACYKSLKNGGAIRIAIPDLKYAVELYGKCETKKMLENYFFVDDLSSYLARHKYMYDFELIKEILIEAGFHSIQQYKYREGKVPNLDILDNRPEDTLFVEAYK